MSKTCPHIQTFKFTQKLCSLYPELLYSWIYDPENDAFRVQTQVEKDFPSLDYIVEWRKSPCWGISATPHQKLHIFRFYNTETFAKKVVFTTVIWLSKLNEEIENSHLCVFTI